MHIDGWSRLGIVTSILYGCLVLVIAMDSRPRLEYKKSAWFSDASQAIAEVLSKSENKEVHGYQVREALLKGTDEENMSWLEKVATSPSENQRKFAAQVAQVNRKYKLEISDLPSETTNYWLLALGWWVGGTTLIFLAGWTIGWVYRGFRKTAA